MLVGDTVKEHRRNRMEGKEPPPRLVHSLGNEVGREVGPLIHHLAVLKGVVQLCIGHCPGVKPHINEVSLPNHWPPLAVAEDHVVYIGSVEIDPLVILIRILAHDKASIGKGIALHQPLLHREVDLAGELLDGSDTLQLAIVLVVPDRQRSTPVA